MEQDNIEITIENIKLNWLWEKLMKKKKKQQLQLEIQRST